MIQIRTKIKVWENFPSELDPSVLYIAKISFNAIPWETSTKYHPEVGYLALLKDGQSCTTSRAHFIAVLPSDSEAISTSAFDYPNDILMIFGEMWTVQNLNVPWDPCPAVIINQPINLTRIIVAVRCAETRSYIEKALSERTILKDVHSDHFMVNQGSCFLKQNSDSVVLKCDPVQQGLLTLRTEVIIADLGHRGRNSTTSGGTGRASSSSFHRTSLSMSSHSSFPNLARKRDSLKSLEMYEKAATFLTTLMGSVKPIPIRKLALSASHELLRTVADSLSIGSRFSVSVLLQPLWIKKDAEISSILSANRVEERAHDAVCTNADDCYTNDLSNDRGDFSDHKNGGNEIHAYPSAVLEDENSVVYVSAASYDRLTRRQQLWFLMSSPDERFIKRLVHICSLNCATDDNVPDSDSDALLNPVLWFNFNQHPSSLVQSAVVVSLSPYSSIPKYFHTVRLSLIRSPGMSDENIEKWFPLVEQYFAVARVVRKEDILVLSAPGCLALESGRESVYFQVTESEPADFECGLASKANTFIFLCGSTGFYVPVTMDRYLRPSKFSLFESLSASVFAPQVSDLLTIVKACGTGNCVRRVPGVLLHGDRGSGKQIVVNGLARHLNLQVYEINVVSSVVADTAAAMEARLQNLVDKVLLCAPCLVVFRHLDYLVGDKEEPRVWKTLGAAVNAFVNAVSNLPVIVLGTCSCKPSPFLEDIFPIHRHVPAISGSDRTHILTDFIENMDGRVSCDVDVQAVADRTSAFVFSDMFALLENSQLDAVRRVRTKCFPGRTNWDIRSEHILQLSGVTIEQCDFDSAVHHMLKSRCTKYGLSLDSTVTWDDIGSLEDAKREILRTIQLPLLSSQIQSSGLQRLGILLCGPPGNGKTLLVKAVAAQCSLNFISVKGPELINMYVGQSEENVRSVFERARLAAPCIIFFDEIDSLAPRRGRSGDSGGVVDRVVSQLMTEMDGLSSNNRIFVFGATNRPDLIDSALLRPGRFDKIIEVGHPKTPEARLQILHAVLRKCSLSPSCDLTKIESKLAQKSSGADLYAACAAAQARAIGRLIDQEKLDDIPVIEPEDFFPDLSEPIPEP